MSIRRSLRGKGAVLFISFVMWLSVFLILTAVVR